MSSLDKHINLLQSQEQLIGNKIKFIKEFKNIQSQNHYYYS